MIKKFILLCLLLTTTVGSASTVVAQETAKDPYKLVAALSEELISALSALPKDESKGIDAKPVIENVLFPHIDIKYVSYSVLGKYLKKTTKAQREAFTQAFSGHLLKTYSVTLKQFNDQTIEVMPARTSFEEKKKVSVKTIVRSKQGPPIDVFFKLRKNKNTAQWQIYDLVAEGISLLNSKRSEFSKKLKDDGIEETTKFLLNS